MKKITLTLILSFIAIFSFAQDDPCASVLIYTGNNVSVKIKKAFIAEEIHDQYCKTRSSNYSSSLGAKLEKLGFSSRSTKQNLTEFCKVYEKQFKQTVIENEYSRQAVDLAIQSWLECQKLNNDGVLISPDVTGQLININIQQSSKESVKIQGVRTVNCEKCEATINNESVLVGADFEFSVTDGRNFQIVCYRKVETDSNGQKYYPEVEITIGTDQAQFSMKLVDETLPPLQTVRQINAKMIQLESRIDDVEPLITDLRKFQILATLRVEGGTLTSSSKGVMFNSSSGNVTFENPENLKYIPLVTNLRTDIDYLTTTNFTRQIISNNEFRVWSTALDTGNRNYPPSYFTVTVIAYKE